MRGSFEVSCDIPVMLMAIIFLSTWAQIMSLSLGYLSHETSIDNGSVLCLQVLMKNACKVSFGEDGQFNAKSAISAKIRILLKEHAEVYIIS